jgi:small subunit ribosomal protein S9
MSDPTTPETAPAAAPVAPVAPVAAPASAAASGIPAPPPTPGHGAAVGRRKTSTARARVSPGEGKMAVNGRAVDAYFCDLRNRRIAVRPLETLGARSRYDVSVDVRGGGPTGQAGAVALAVARALSRAEGDLRLPARQSGLLTRDSRRKERKKYGRRGARRGFQFSKR